MPHEDKYAFDAMNAADPEMDVTGGAIKYSEYEMDMTPSEQKNFEKETFSLFQSLYNVDPLVDRKKLPYKSWLKTLNSERIEELSKEYEDVEAPRNPETIIANDIMRKASKHWGGTEGFESLRKMASSGSKII